jgi:hypothetical protein
MDAGKLFFRKDLTMFCADFPSPPSSFALTNYAPVVPYPWAARCWESGRQLCILIAHNGITGEFASVGSDRYQVAHEELLKLLDAAA